MLFHENDAGLELVHAEEFQTEKQLQNLVEKNLEALFGCKFVATEFSTGDVHGGRVDSLALSEDNNPVVIEYKKVKSANVVTQALYYLSWINDHKGDFESAVRSSIGDVEVSWNHIRVLCIAPGFDRYSLHAVKLMGAGLELWEYKRYTNGMIQFDEIYKRSTDAPKKQLSIEHEDPTDVISEVYTLEDHMARAGESVLPLAQRLHEELLGMSESMETVPHKIYVAYKYSKNVASVQVLRGSVKVWLPLPYQETMPEFMRDVTDIGHQGTGNLEAQIVQEHELDQLIPYLRQSLSFVSGE